MGDNEKLSLSNISLKERLSTRGTIVIKTDMGWDPPTDLEKFRLKDSNKDNDDTNATQVVACENSTHSSSKVQNQSAITVALTEEQIAWVHNFQNLMKSGLIRVQPSIGDDSSSHRLQHTQNSADLNEPTERNQRAAAEGVATESPENRSFSGDFRVALNTGVCSPHQSASPHQISEQMAGGIVKEHIAGEVAGAPATFSGENQCHPGRFNDTYDLHQVRVLESSSNNSNLKNMATGLKSDEQSQQQIRSLNSGNSISFGLLGMEEMNPQLSNNRENNQNSPIGMKFPTQQNHCSIGGAGAPVNILPQQQYQKIHMSVAELPSQSRCFESSPLSSNSKSRQDTHKGDLHSFAGFEDGILGLEDNQQHQHENINQLNENMHMLDNVKLNDHYSNSGKRDLGNAHQCNSEEVAEVQGICGQVPYHSDTRGPLKCKNDTESQKWNNFGNLKLEMQHGTEIHHSNLQREVSSCLLVWCRYHDILYIGLKLQQLNLDLLHQQLNNMRNQKKSAIPNKYNMHLQNGIRLCRNIEDVTLAEPKKFQPKKICVDVSRATLKKLADLSLIMGNFITWSFQRVEKASKGCRNTLYNEYARLSKFQLKWMIKDVSRATMKNLQLYSCRTTKLGCRHMGLSVFRLIGAFNTKIPKYNYYGNHISCNNMINNHINYNNQYSSTTVQHPISFVACCYLISCVAFILDLRYSKDTMEQSRCAQEKQLSIEAGGTTGHTLLHFQSATHSICIIYNHMTSRCCKITDNTVLAIPKKFQLEWIIVDVSRATVKNLAFLSHMREQIASWRFQFVKKVYECCKTSPNTVISNPKKFQLKRIIGNVSRANLKKLADLRFVSVCLVLLDFFYVFTGSWMCINFGEVEYAFTTTWMEFFIRNISQHQHILTGTVTFTTKLTFKEKSLPGCVGCFVKGLFHDGVYILCYIFQHSNYWSNNYHSQLLGIQKIQAHYSIKILSNSFFGNSLVLVCTHCCWPVYCILQENAITTTNTFIMGNLRTDGNSHTLNSLFLKSLFLIVVVCLSRQVQEKVKRSNNKGSYSQHSWPKPQLTYTMHNKLGKFNFSHDCGCLLLFLLDCLYVITVYRNTVRDQQQPENATLGLHRLLNFGIPTTCIIQHQNWSKLGRITSYPISDKLKKFQHERIIGDVRRATLKKSAVLSLMREQIATWSFYPVKKAHKGCKTTTNPVTSNSNKNQLKRTIGNVSRATLKKLTDLRFVSFCFWSCWLVFMHLQVAGGILNHVTLGYFLNHNSLQIHHNVTHKEHLQGHKEGHSEFHHRSSTTPWIMTAIQTCNSQHTTTIAAIPTTLESLFLFVVVCLSIQVQEKDRSNNKRSCRHHNWSKPHHTCSRHNNFGNFILSPMCGCLFLSLLECWYVVTGYRTSGKDQHQIENAILGLYKLLNLEISKTCIIQHQIWFKLGRSTTYPIRAKPKKFQRRRIIGDVRRATVKKLAVLSLMKEKIATWSCYLVKKTYKCCKTTTNPVISNSKKTQLKRTIGNVSRENLKKLADLRFVSGWLVLLDCAYISAGFWMCINLGEMDNALTTTWMEFLFRNIIQQQQLLTGIVPITPKLEFNEKRLLVCFMQDSFSVGVCIMKCFPQHSNKWSYYNPSQLPGAQNFQNNYHMNSKTYNSSPGSSFLLVCVISCWLAYWILQVVRLQTSPPNTSKRIQMLSPLQETTNINTSTYSLKTFRMDRDSFGKNSLSLDLLFFFVFICLSVQLQHEASNLDSADTYSILLHLECIKKHMREQISTRDANLLFGFCLSVICLYVGFLMNCAGPVQAQTKHNITRTMANPILAWFCLLDLAGLTETQGPETTTSVLLCEGAINSYCNHICAESIIPTATTRALHFITPSKHEELQQYHWNCSKNSLYCFPFYALLCFVLFVVLMCRQSSGNYTCQQQKQSSKFQLHDTVPSLLSSVKQGPRSTENLIVLGGLDTEGGFLLMHILAHGQHLQKQLPVTEANTLCNNWRSSKLIQHLIPAPHNEHLQSSYLCMSMWLHVQLNTALQHSGKHIYLFVVGYMILQVSKKLKEMKQQHYKYRESSNSLSQLQHLENALKDNCSKCDVLLMYIFWRCNKPDTNASTDSNAPAAWPTTKLMLSSVGQICSKF